MDSLNQHYVYIYRDSRGKPLYVGYGAKAVRSSAHIGKLAHNPALTEKLNGGRYVLEIAGPFGDEQRARAVETALISAFQREGTLTNIDKGHHNWRFRPLGVPNAFVGRIDKAALTSKELSVFAKRTGGIIFVRISDEDLIDGRPGDLMANIPNDSTLCRRIDRWWQLYSHAAREWVDTPKNSPGLLIGLAGTGAMRLVIASLAIDKNGWARAIGEREPNGLLSIPHSPDLNKLDASGLRGRRVDPTADLNFGRLRHETFIVMDRHGGIVKGGRKIKKAV